MPPSMTPTAADESSVQKPEPEKKTEMLMTSTPYSESKKIANGCYIRSQKLDASGHSWYIVYYPNDRLPGTTASISLYLQLDTHAAIAGHEEEEEDIRVRLKFYLLGLGGGVRFISAEVTGTVNTTRNSIGFERFVTREDLEMSGCVSNDWLNMRCDVTVLDPTDCRPSSLDTVAPPPAVVQEPNSVNKAPSSPPQKPASVDVDTAQLSSSEPNKTPSSVWKTMNAEEVEAVVKDLLAAADQYDLKDLKLIVENKLCDHVRVTTVLSMLVLAEQFQCLKLKSTCFRFIASPENTRDVMATGHVEQLAKTCPGVVRELVTSLLDAREAAPSR